MVRTENLTKEFKEGFLANRHPIKALDNLNLQVQSGEIFGYLGPNGAGKTTTFKLLLGLISPTSGSAWIFGRDIGEVKPKAKVGFMPEQPYFYDYLTGEEFLNFYAQLFRFDRKTRKQKVHSLLEAVGLEEAASIQLRKYSRGMLQRVGIAQALINDPELVILDEPLSGLDPIGRKEIRDIIHRLKNDGRTVIFSSHVLSDVETICDRVGILMRGKLQSVERLDEFRNVELESVEITVSSLSKADSAAIQSFGGQVSHNGNRTIITLHGIGSPDGEEAMGKILAYIRESDAMLISISSQTRSLEDLFVSVDSSLKETKH
ncbi:ABC transporter ATP-binding protein [Candidatus Poribacteria bacterium]